eukprot:COSAG04_NODE_23206_length_342_cov_0.637860_1_plen_38_part_10
MGLVFTRLIPSTPTPSISAITSAVKSSTRASASQQKSA